MKRDTPTPDLIMPAHVAALFGVDPKTVTRWAKAGKLTCVRTLGGHRRFVESEVRDLLAGITGKPADEVELVPPDEPSPDVAEIEALIDGHVQ